MKTQLLRIALAVLLMAPLRAADVPISGLPAITTVTGTTIVPVVDTAGTPATKRATVAQLVAGLPAATGSVAGTMSAADKTKLDAAVSTNTASAIVRRDASGNFAANVITAASVTGLSDPVLGSDAATKSYVDASAAGLVIKTPAKAATTPAIGNITVAGGAPTTLDGVTLNTNDRVLVKDQSDAIENGIYYVQTLGSGANGTWLRTTDADTGAELVTGSYVFVTNGTVNTQSAWTMVTPGTITIGTSLITWNLFSQTTQILASNIIGQIVAAQIQDSAINTAKFAAGITPVEILGSLPGTGNFQGRTVFLTTDSKLYRYTGASFTAVVAATDLTGQITGVQITDNAITAPKISSGSVTTAKLAAGAVTANELAANSVVAGKIAAAAISATEIAAGAITTAKIFAGAVDTAALAANAVTAAKIQAGTITADKLNVSSLSAIAANIGTITSGTLTSSTSITVGSGSTAVSISSAGLVLSGGRINMAGDGVTPFIRVFNSGGTNRIEITGQNNVLIPASVLAVDSSGSLAATYSSAGLALNGTARISLSDSGTSIVGPGSIKSIPGDADSVNFVFGEYGTAGSQDGFIGLVINGAQKKIPFYSF